MTVQRQYTLANCKLVLEGWEDAADPAAPQAIRPMVSIVTRVECHFSGVEKPLSGGQELLTNLIHTVSRYAQGMLSGIEHPAPNATQTTARVQMQAMAGDRHRLTVNQAGSDTDPSKYQVDLSTTQLFDLVEVVDQLVADGQTLPQLSVDLSPVPKRFVASQEPVTEKLLPATLGVSSLAAAAIALFLLPVPEVERPEVDGRPPIEEAAPDATTSGSGTGGPEPGIEPTSEGTGDATLNDSDPTLAESQSPEDADSDTADSDTADNDATAVAPDDSTSELESDNLLSEPDATDDAAVEPESGAPDDIVEAADGSTDGSADEAADGSIDESTDGSIDESTDDTAIEADPDATDGTVVEVAPDVEETPAVSVPGLADEKPDSVANLPDTDEVDDLLRSAQPIADPDKLTDLTRLLRNRVDEAWERPETITQDFVYRVGVSERGDLVGFTAINDQGFEDAADNPLNQLDTAPVSVGDAERPVGQFRVVFRTTGVVEVSPWYGRLPE